MKILINFLIIFFISINLNASDFTLKKITNLNEPWGSTFLNNNELLITEKSGKILIVNLKDKKSKIISHNLKVLEYGQGGLLDIIFRDNIVWVSYSEDRGNYKTSTSIARGDFNRDNIIFENIFQANPPIDSPYHFGSRLAPVKTPDKISTIHAKPDPLNPAIGNCTPARAFKASVVGFPFLSKAEPSGIFVPIFAASLILPLLTFDIDVSNMKGTLSPVGLPKHIGLVPNKLFLAPWGASAGGAFVKHRANKFFFTACSA